MVAGSVTSTVKLNSQAKTVFASEWYYFTNAADGRLALA